MAQNIIFPMSYMNITQGVGVGTHVGSNAIDNAGKDTGIDSVFAPFDGVIKKIWLNGNSVWLESLNPVQFADGTVDYATIFFTHDNNVSDLKVGQIIWQGQNFYSEGTAGNATGNHVHMEIARGKFTGTGWHQNAQGYWVLNNSVHPTQAFFTGNSTIINGYGYSWKGDNTAVETIKSMYLRLLGREADQGGIDTYTKEASRKGWEFVYTDLKNSDEGQKDWAWRNPDRVRELERQLAEKPKEVIKEVPVEKPVEVIKEVIKEVPVEKIVEKEVVREVVIGDEDRTAGDLIIAGLRKILKIK